MDEKNAVYNPHDVAMHDLPVIYGFNNGGSPGWYRAQLLTEDGTPIGGHLCSDESFMPGDLGIIEGTRQDRHEGFKKHYPSGYRMEFVPSAEIDNHDGLQRAFRRFDETHAPKD